METLRDLDLVRALNPATEVRAADEGGMPTMVVRFSAFNAWYEINSYFEGKFLERTVKGAFRKTIKENRSNVKVLFDHGFDYRIGNLPLGVISDLREDSDSPVGEVPLLDAPYVRDLLPGLEAGAYGSSFRFRVIKEEWNDEPGRSDHNPDGLPERTIKEVRLFEFGPVTFPANPESTAGIRCLTDQYYERLRQGNPQQYDELLSRARALRTPEQAAAPSTAAPEAATPTDEPAERHSGGLTHGQRRAFLYPFLTKGDSSESGGTSGAAA
jgi:HK97 family phage prohead protease